MFGDDDTVDSVFLGDAVVNVFASDAAVNDVFSGDAVVSEFAGDGTVDDVFSGDGIVNVFAGDDAVDDVFSSDGIVNVFAGDDTVDDVFSGDGIVNVFAGDDTVDDVYSGDGIVNVFAGDDAVDEGQQPGARAPDGGALHGRPYLRQPGLHRRVHRRDARVRECAHRRVVGSHHTHHCGLRRLLPHLRQRILHRVCLRHHGAAAAGHAHRHHRHQLFHLLREPCLVRAAAESLDLHQGGAGQGQPLRQAGKKEQLQRASPQLSRVQLLRLWWRHCRRVCYHP